MATRRRAACQTCHARKVKCDVTIVGTPCTNCQKANRLDCSAHEKKRRAGGGRGSFPGMLPHGDYASINDPNVANAYSTSSPNGQVYPPPRASVGSPGSAPIPDPLLGTMYQTRPARIAEMPALNRKDEDLTYLGSEASNIDFITRVNGRDPNCHHVPTTSLRQVVNLPRQVPTEVLQLPDKPLVDQLIRAFFAYVNPIFPVVDERPFMAQYNRQGPMEPSGSPSLLLLQAMLAATSQIVYDNKKERESMKSMFFHRTKVLIDCQYERSRDVVVQSCLLLAYTGGSLAEGDAYFWVRYAATIAFDLGMHRDAEASVLSIEAKQMRRRVFWLLFAIDTASVLRGRPSAISLEDCDVQEIQATDFSNCGQNTHIELVLHTIRLSVIVSQSVRACLRPRVQAEQRKQALHNADAALDQWRSQTPQHLQIGQTKEISLQSATLHIAYNHAIVLLHRSGRASHPSPDDSEKCSAAATHIQTAAEQLGRQGLLKYLPYNAIEACAAAMAQLQSAFGQSAPAEAQQRIYSLQASLGVFVDQWPQFEADMGVLMQSRATTGVQEVQNQEQPPDVSTSIGPTPKATMLDPALSGGRAEGEAYQNEMPHPQDGTV